MLAIAISFQGFINFFLGMLTGIVLFLASLTFLFVRGKNIELDIRKPEGELSEDDLRQLIRSRQDKLRKVLKKKNNGVFKLTFEISYELVEEISRYFFPNSKYPMYELSVNELLELNHYITDRIDEILEVPVLKNAKKAKIITIVNMYEKKKAIQDSRLARAAKKLKLGKVAKYGGMALNAVNPVYWFRKLVLSTSIDAMTRKLCVAIIGVVGEETSKVYSKKLFDKEIELGLVDENMEALLTEGDEDIDEVEEPERVL